MADVRPRAAILAIGDELILGRLVDTNSAHLAGWCAEQGLRVSELTVLPDAADAIVAALKRCAGTCDLVLVTGGLGPTADDRTREALASALGVEQTFREDCWRDIREIYGRLRPGAAVPASNRRQAWLPHGSEPLANDRGTAPGVCASLDGAVIVCLPGVPHEMVAMVERFADELPDRLPGSRRSAVDEVWIAGLGESHAADRLGELLASDGQQVGITAQAEGHLTVRIVGEAAAVARRAAAVRERMREHLLPAAGLAPSLVAVCRERGLAVTGAESCTCGQVVRMLGAVPGVSAVLHEWLVAYHDSVKQERLGVSAEDIARHGAVSEAVVAQMARGALARTGADLAIATSGIAGPDGGSADKPVGTAWIAVADILDGAPGPAVAHRPTRLTTRRLAIPGDRMRVQDRAAASALHLAWERLFGSVRPNGGGLDA